MQWLAYVVYLVRVNFEGYGGRKRILHEVESQHETWVHFEQFCRLPRRPNMYTTQFDLFSIRSLLKTLLILLLLKVAINTFQDAPFHVPLFCSLNWIFSLSLFVDLCMRETCLTVPLELNWTSQASMFFNWQEEPPLIVIYSRFTLNGSVPSMVSAGSDVFILMW